MKFRLLTEVACRFTFVVGPRRILFRAVKAIKTSFPTPRNFPSLDPQNTQRSLFTAQKPLSPVVYTHWVNTEGPPGHAISMCFNACSTTVSLKPAA